MHMRTIALTGMVLIALTLGCSKKTEEQAEKAPMPSPPASQEAAPAPMQGMGAEGSQSDDMGTTETQGNGEEQSQGDKTPSDMN